MSQDWICELVFEDRIPQVERENGTFGSMGKLL